MCTLQDSRVSAELVKIPRHRIPINPEYFFFFSTVEHRLKKMKKMSQFFLLLLCHDCILKYSKNRNIPYLCPKNSCLLNSNSFSGRNLKKRWLDDSIERKTTGDTVEPGRVLIEELKVCKKTRVGGRGKEDEEIRLVAAR